MMIFHHLPAWTVHRVPRLHEPRLHCLLCLWVCRQVCCFRPPRVRQRPLEQLWLHHCDRVLPGHHHGTGQFGIENRNRLSLMGMVCRSELEEPQFRCCDCSEQWGWWVFTFTFIFFALFHWWVFTFQFFHFFTSGFSLLLSFFFFPFSLVGFYFSLFSLFHWWFFTFHFFHFFTGGFSLFTFHWWVLTFSFLSINHWLALYKLLLFQALLFFIVTFG